jgi:uncharacterized protein involved in exopolysaccharide biosynthesis
MLSIVLICTLGTGVTAWWLPQRYDAVTLLSPVTRQSGGGSLTALGSAVSQLGGLASLAGLSVNSDSEKAVIIATLESEALTQRFIRDNDLLPILFASRWDARLKRWDVKRPDEVPTIWIGERYFSKRVRSVTENAKTGLVTLTIRWTDPTVAARWANSLVKLANDDLRDQAIEESERDISYLSDQVVKTNVLQLRDAIYSLMENEIKEEMLARGSEQYALKVVDPAIPPERPSFPPRLLWALAGFSAGVVLALLIALMRDSLSSRRVE